uniref:Aminopeptidase n=1 Tax=Anopheles farauti TaxID=69004 RepID=A0A1Y9H9E6_9DIPT
MRLLQSATTVVLFVLVFCTIAQTFSPPEHKLNELVQNVNDEDGYLLPPVSEPLSYDLFLDMTDASFSSYYGTVDITLKYTGTGSIFSINSAGLVINETSLHVTNSREEQLPIESFVDSSELQKITFRLNKPMETNEIYKVHIEFTGTISTDFFKGLYRSSYRVGRDTKYLATTFFAATYARTVFPCYDEPAYKAKFNIKIRHLPQHTALSNMPAVQSDHIGEYKETIFGTTPLMSTYLVAFVVSEFETIHTDGGLFRVFAPENKVNETTYAREFAVRSLRAMETHFGRQNQMPKIYLLAIPDFAMGAMENWGLITFREDLLLYENEEQTAALAKQKIASVITHELVHMWFGNEVTPEWWTYVWLNEGFAKYYEYYITAQLEPSWNLWDQFIQNNVHYAFARDCKSTARPMNFYATDPTILNELYDYVVYEKSASVIRMIQNVIGFETFRQVINDYLRSRSYLSTKPQYLYASIEKFNSVDLPDTVEAIFESWANAPFDSTIPVINRAQLVDDVSNLARAGEVDYEVALSLLQYLERETEYIPWSTAYNALLHLDQMFSNNKEYTRFESFCRNLTGYVFNETTTIKSGNHLNRLHQDKSGYLACYYGVPACLKEASNVLNVALQDETLNVPKEKQSTVFCALHKYELSIGGDYSASLLQKYWSEPEKYQALVDKLIDSMGCSRNTTIIEFYLDIIKLNTVVLPITLNMKSNILISMIKGSPEARAAALRYINAEFDLVSGMLNQQLAQVFEAFALSINAPEERKQFQQLVDTHQSSMTTPVLQAANRALVQSDQNVHWIDKHAGAVAKWLVEKNFENGDDDDNGVKPMRPAAGWLAIVGIITINAMLQFVDIK